MRLGSAPAYWIAIVLLAARADADPAQEHARARAAYDRGTVAHMRGDHATAARELALADALVPNPVALEAALQEALEASEAVLAMELCARSERAPAGATLAALVRKARARFASKVGRLRADCGGACSVLLDGRPIDAGRWVFVAAGRHSVTVTRDSLTDARVVDVAPGGDAEIAASRPVSPALPWFGALGGASLVAGAFAVGFGVDTANKHSDFVGEGCDGPVHDDCTALASAGRAAQRRTHIALGTAVGLGAAAVVAGVIALRPRGVERAAVVLGGTQIAALRIPLP